MSLQKEWEKGMGCCLQQQPQLPFPVEKQNTKLAQLREKKNLKNQPGKHVEQTYVSTAMSCPEVLRPAGEAPLTP